VVLWGGLGINLDEIIQNYRKIALEEIEGKRAPREKVSNYRLTDLYASNRPYFSSLSNDDPKYVVLLRGMRYGHERTIGPMVANIWYQGGHRLGHAIVSSGRVKNLDDLKAFMIEHKIGLLDVLENSEDSTKINLYECIACSGIPNIGKAVCTFEAGLIAGVLEKLTGKNLRVVEKYCHGLGHSFCGFEVLYI